MFSGFTPSHFKYNIVCLLFIIWTPVVFRSVWPDDDKSVGIENENDQNVLYSDSVSLHLDLVLLCVLCVLRVLCVLSVFSVAASFMSWILVAPFIQQPHLHHHFTPRNPFLLLFLTKIRNCSQLQCEQHAEKINLFAPAVCETFPLICVKLHTNVQFTF